MVQNAISDLFMHSCKNNIIYILIIIYAIQHPDYLDHRAIKGDGSLYKLAVPDIGIAPDRSLPVSEKDDCTGMENDLLRGDPLRGISGIECEKLYRYADLGGKALSLLASDDGAGMV